VRVAAADSLLPFLLSGDIILKAWTRKEGGLGKE